MNNKIIVLTWGRMNPPTSGHELLVNTVINVAKKYNADHLVYLTKTQDSKKNPLSLDQKLFYARKAFPEVNIVGANDKVRTLIDALKSLTGKYDELILIVGADRVNEFNTLLNKYNGKDFNFKKITIISAGERDPDADSVIGMSATKMRQAAAEGNFNQFKIGAPSKLNPSLVKKMYDDLRIAMGIKEEYINEKDFNIGDIVLYQNEEYTIINRGPNFLYLENENGICKAWTKDCLIKEGNSMLVRPQDKMKAAKIIASALDYKDIKEKTPEEIINDALHFVKKRTLNSEEKKILKQMLELVKKLGIKFDETIISLSEAVEDDDFEDEEKFDEEDLLKDITDDDIIEHGYDDDEFHIVDDETGEVVDVEEVFSHIPKEDVKEEVINEVLSRVERIRAKVRMARTKAKRERSLRIALKKRSSSEVLAKRARRIAVKTLERRLAKKPLNQLSVAEKERIEARVAKMKPLIARIALRLVPRVRQIEKERLAHKR